MSEIVLVTQLEFSKGEDVFGSAAEGFIFHPVAADEPALAEAVMARNSRAVIVGVTRYAGNLYAALRHTGGDRPALIARFGVGHDNVDKAKARSNNIIVTNTPGTLDQSVAEHAIWLMGNLAKHLPSSEVRLRSGEFGGNIGEEIHGKSLGIIGCGGIGRRVASIAHFGLGMRVFAAGRRTGEDLAWDTGKSVEEIQTEYGLDHYTNDVEAVIRVSDFVSLHLPANESTRYFMNAERLSWMKPEAMLINTARGSLVDEAALYDALTDGVIAGAALDVFEEEPYRPVSPEKDLRRLSNVILTPHTGSNTRQANERMARSCIRNVSLFFENRLKELPRVDIVTLSP